MDPSPYSNTVVLYAVTPAPLPWNVTNPNRGDKPSHEIASNLEHGKVTAARSKKAPRAQHTTERDRGHHGGIILIGIGGDRTAESDDSEVWGKNRQKPLRYVVHEEEGDELEGMTRSVSKNPT
jgi:hypothetical protein